jgi:hypothetical protein
MPAFDIPANLAFDNYTDLITAIEDWMNRSDLSGSVQAMVALAEARMRRELVPYFGELSTSIACTDGVGGLPADYGTARRLVYDTRALDNVSATGGTNIPDSLSEPYGYSIEAGSLKLWPAVDATVTLLYQPTIPFLSEEAPTNNILSAHPDLYFFGTMLFAEGYVANDSRAGLFKGLWDEAIDSAKQYFTRQKFGGPMVPRVGFVP